MLKSEYISLISTLTSLGMSPAKGEGVSGSVSYQDYYWKGYTLRGSREYKEDPNDSYRVVIISAGQSDDLGDRIDTLLTRCDNMVSFDQYSTLEQDILYIGFEIADITCQYDHMKSSYEEIETELYHKIRSEEKNNAETIRRVDLEMIKEKKKLSQIKAQLDRSKAKYRAIERFLEHTKSRFIHEATEEKRQREAVNKQSASDGSKQFIS